MDDLIKLVIRSKKKLPNATAFSNNVRKYAILQLEMKMGKL
jgi:hypothetical protein